MNRGICNISPENMPKGTRDDAKLALSNFLQADVSQTPIFGGLLAEFIVAADATPAGPKHQKT